VHLEAILKTLGIHRRVERLDRVRLPWRTEDRNAVGREGVDQ
jgi:hypothetical protein